jgi:hypothetical protein
MIRVTDSVGATVTGDASLADQERRWLFTTDNPWKRGPHKIVVQTTIEDLAGNNIGKPFDVDVFERVERKITSPTVTLAFEVK